MCGRFQLPLPHFRPHLHLAPTPGTCSDFSLCTRPLCGDVLAFLAPPLASFSHSFASGSPRSPTRPTRSPTVREGIPSSPTRATRPQATLS
eukprot:4609477-Prymnesium_polylepis.2